MGEEAMSETEKDKGAIDSDLAEDIPTKTDGPLGLLKLQASVEGMRVDLRKAVDDIHAALQKVEANYTLMFNEFSNRLDEHSARLDVLERHMRVKRSAPMIARKKTRKK
jgi:hypothetical protein